MNRRGFLSLLGLGAAGLVLDPERLLWVPGQKTIFLPSVAAPVPNIGQIVAEAWEAHVGNWNIEENAFSGYWMLNKLSEPEYPQGESRLYKVNYA